MSLYLSRLILNPASAQARMDLRSRYELHRTLSRGWGEDRKTYQNARCLFRLDEHPSPAQVLVQSRTEPDWSALPNGYLVQEAQVKELDLRFTEGQLLRFLLLANPTRREPAGHAVHAVTGKPKDGPRRALVFRDPTATDTACRGWLSHKGEGSGFQPLRFEVEDRGVIKVAKDGKQVPYPAVRFEGRLRVMDAQRFRQAVEQGIGSAKGFGFGLLSLARA